MRPTFSLLDDQLIAQIIDEARDLLRTLGVTIHNREVLSLLGDHGADVDLKTEQAILSDEILDRALATAPHSFNLFDVLGDADDLKLLRLFHIAHPSRAGVMPCWACRKCGASGNRFRRPE